MTYDSPVFDYNLITFCKGCFQTMEKTTEKERVMMATPQSVEVPIHNRQR
jgi:hypothetical protein